MMIQLSKGDKTKLHTVKRSDKIEEYAMRFCVTGGVRECQALWERPLRCQIAGT
jgi:hypothetical protein